MYNRPPHMQSNALLKTTSQMLLHCRFHKEVDVIIEIAGEFVA